MKKILSTWYNTGIILLLCWQPVFAEDIKIPIGTQMPELSNVARPKTGMSKTQVKKQFGEPIKENLAKGKPPISSWEYADFIVYFDTENTIYSALKPKQHETTETIIEETVEMKEDDLKVK
jgi:hypothetical protein